jgi:hypothetical protein
MRAFAAVANLMLFPAPLLDANNATSPPALSNRCRDYAAVGAVNGLIFQI